MKNLFLLILLCPVLLIIGSCGEGIAPIGGGVLPKIDTLDCPYPEYLLGGQGPKNRPTKSHKLQRISTDGTKIAYTVNENIIKIITLKTGTVETYEPKKMMPPNVSFSGCFDLRWCPYDDNKLCFMFVTGIDTTSKGRIGVYGQNLFILHRKENIFEKIDLPYASQAGPKTLLLYGWLKGSTPMADSLFLLYGSNSWYLSGIIIPQEKKIISIPEFDKLGSYGFLQDYLFSPNGQHSATIVQQMDVPPFGNNIFIDGIPLRIAEDTIDLLSRLSWSPDGKNLAVTLMASRKWESVWVIDVDKWLRERPTFAPVEKIDFQKRFCMYNFGGGPIDAEFITNTTLAVSSHHDGDVLCPLWEITTDGRLLRQITHDD
ncbi:MAG: hypothetical protein JST20_03600 [Bacteroidetes bacterium]|nr:hypothetical protein [Bacteroidota bacterium]